MKYIYALVDPRTRMIHYVGQAYDVDSRYTQHMSDAAKTTKVAWLTELKKMGAQPGLHILQQCEDSEVNHIENWWIALGRRQGWPLTNGTNPGEWRFKDDFTQIYSEHLVQMESDYKQKLDDLERLQRAEINAQRKKIERLELESILSAVKTERMKWVSIVSFIVYTLFGAFALCNMAAFIVWSGMAYSTGKSAEGMTAALFAAMCALVFPQMYTHYKTIRLEEKQKPYMYLGYVSYAISIILLATLSFPRIILFLGTGK